MKKNRWSILVALTCLFSFEDKQYLPMKGFQKIKWLPSSIFRITRISYYVMIFTFLIILLPDNAIAGTFKVFGPETFQRQKGKPNKESRPFSVINPNTKYLIKVYNGGLGNSEYEKVSSAVLVINGIVVVGPKAFKKNVDYIEKRIELDVTNELVVEVRSKPGGAVAIEIIGIDNELPNIEASISPSPNEYGWNNEDVTVSFTCDDAISGILSCPDPVTVELEGEDQTVNGTATDNAGNSKTVSVTVNIDKTPPSIMRNWPPDDNFGTDRASIEIEGTFTDVLSGVIEAELQHDSNIIALNIPFLPISRPLDTNIPSGEPWQTNEFELEVTDRAGNSIQQTFSVRYTLGATVSPTDSARTELVDGLLTSVDRAIVRFKTEVTRDRIHEVIHDQGGKVGGFLPTANIAIAVFKTEHVVDLKTILNSLENRDEVAVVIPAMFLPSMQFDNDILPEPDAAAYDNIGSSLASEFIIDNLLPIAPVNIAVVETGLDDTYGLNNEFDNINFYNLCTAEGQQGLTGTPVDTPGAHGTKITGIIAGADNGYGNNGVIRGIPGSQFGVNVFRMNCGEGVDPALICAAFDLIVGGTVGNIDVVNMSFGWLFADPATGANVRSIYEGYFDSPAGREILWVGGAGNDNEEIGCNEFLPSGLACDLDNVISVGGYNPDDLMRGDEWIASSGAVFGSNWGEGVTFSAPGTGVWTAIDPGDYGGVSGTSAAAPLVTGAAALLLAVEPMVPLSVKQRLVDTTQPLFDNDLPEGGLDVLALIQTASLPIVVYDNGASTHSGGSAVGHMIAADDFVLNVERTVSRISVDVSDGPADQNRRWDGTVEWWLFDDNAGVPGSLMAFGTGVNVNQHNIVESPLGHRDFTVDFDLGQEIDLPGDQTFWLALHMQADYSRMSVFWDHQGSTVGHPSRSGGELIGGLPNFVDGQYAGTSAFDKAFRLWTN